jgi:hypothetical protein
MAWQDAPEVARAGLDALARNTSVAVPGAMNKVAAVMSDISPTVITRRVAALLGKYYDT